MAYYEMMPAGLPAGLQSGMDSVFNKKFGTSTSYAPGTWPDTVNLLGPLPEATASGAVAHLEDGADGVPLKNWLVTLPASLDGYSEVNGTKSGKNLISASDFEQGSINATGVELDSTSRLRSNYMIVNADADYSFSVSGTDIQIYFVFQYNAAGGFISRDPVDATSGSITLRANTKYFRLLIRKTNNATIIPSDLTSIQLEQSATPTTYEVKSATTYTASLGRTIYGGMVDVIKGTAEPTNWLNNTLATQTVNGTTFTVNADKSITVSGTPSQQTRVYISQEAITINEAMFFSFGTMPTGTRVFCSRTSGASTSYPTISPSHTATLDAVYTNFLLEIGTTFDGTPFTIYPLCNKGSSASDYSPYFAPFTFTPITPTPETELGVNNFWTNEGDSEVIYRRDINLALNALSGLRGLMMARPQLEPETEHEETTEETPEEMER